ncbi:hypothetical protein PHMEG_00040257 [Phytophthora megakarya]|uniref:PiggyBac transposable element-derived protein domain-containing protein n=1 Tax=Phytophthora megakarya TaxID=4795 RepID=A0A225UDW6_9STRA|nr:hypothetical protein PHMEG_00040257 [Phytophthora megakarya]
MQGTFTYTESLMINAMSAIIWWVSKPVYLGSDLALDRTVRREKTGEQHDVPCPKAVKDYHKYMDGVDEHDQLCLQRYSLQQAVTFRKYYTSLILGFVDLTIVNGYIVHHEYHKSKKNRGFDSVGGYDAW